LSFEMVTMQRGWPFKAHISEEQVGPGFGPGKCRKIGLGCIVRAEARTHLKKKDKKECRSELMR
jgi:hypothetical protein